MRNVRDAAPLMREVLGESLREQRTAQGRTLREVSQDARVSLGYLSEIERGQKEASSELLAAICGALDVPLSIVLDDVSPEAARRQRVELALYPKRTEMVPVVPRVWPGEGYLRQNL